jgi:transposase
VRPNTVIRKLLGVTSIVVEGLKLAEEGVVIRLRPRSRKPRCGKCGRRCPGYDRSPSRRWRHLALGRWPFWLEYAPRRVNCARCGVMVEQVPWAAHGSRFTREFEEMTAYLAQRMDQTAVRVLMGIDWRTVGAIVARIVKERLDPQRLEELYVIGVDEISFRRHHNYITVVVDHARRRVVWTGEGKSSETLERFFTELGPERSGKIETATIDMSQAYITVLRDRAPQAQIVFDRFHVQKLASEAVDEVRREQVRKAKGTDQAGWIKDTRFALLKNPWNLTGMERLRLSSVQQHNRPLYRAYLLKETLAKTLDYLQLARAKKALGQWLSWATRSRLAPFVKLAKTIKRHKDGVLAYIPSRQTNGLTEGLNNKTRLITRRAYGFHSAEPLEAMIHLCCGGIRLDPPIPSPVMSLTQ